MSKGGAKRKREVLSEVLRSGITHILSPSTPRKPAASSRKEGTTAVWKRTFLKSPLRKNLLNITRKHPALYRTGKKGVWYTRVIRID